MSIRICRARVAEIRATCTDVRGLSFWAQQDGKGHRVHGGGHRGRIEQLVYARCAEEAVARRLGTRASFVRDNHSRVIIRAIGVHGQGTRLERGQTGQGGLGFCIGFRR